MCGSVSHLRAIQVKLLFAVQSEKRVETTKRKAKQKRKKEKWKINSKSNTKKDDKKINKRELLFGAVLCVCIKGRIDDGIPFDVNVKRRKGFSTQCKFDPPKLRITF